MGLKGVAGIGIAGQTYVSPVITGGATFLSGGWRVYNGATTTTTEYARGEWVANVFTISVETNGGTARAMTIGPAGDAGVNFQVNGATRWGISVSADAYVLYPTTTNAQDIGASAFIVRDVYARQHKTDATITAAGTTGAQTINKAAGTVNFAAAAASVVVTNSLVTANSIVICTPRTNDATFVIKSVVPAAGSFTITSTAAATAETSVGFYVINAT